MVVHRAQAYASLFEFWLSRISDSVSAFHACLTCQNVPRVLSKVEMPSFANFTYVRAGDVAHTHLPVGSASVLEGE